MSTKPKNESKDKSKLVSLLQPTVTSKWRKVNDPSPLVNSSFVGLLLWLKKNKPITTDGHMHVGCFFFFKLAQ